MATATEKPEWTVLLDVAPRPRVELEQHIDLDKDIRLSFERGPHCDFLVAGSAVSDYSESRLTLSPEEARDKMLLVLADKLRRTLAGVERIIAAGESESRD